MQANDPIRSLLSTVADRLSELTDKQEQEGEGMKVALARIETAKGMARLQGQGNTVAQIPGEHVMQALIAASEQRAIITEGLKTLCEIVGSLIVHVEPGAMHTVAGDVLLPPDSGQPTLPGIDPPIMPGCDSDGNADYDTDPAPPPVPVAEGVNQVLSALVDECPNARCNLDKGHAGPCR